MSVKVDGAGEHQRWGLLEQTSTTQPYDDLLVARTLVDLKGQQIPLQVMNLSNQPRKIRKGAELAYCKTVSADCASESDVGVLGSGGSKKNSEPRPFLCVTMPIFLLKTRRYGSFIVPDMMFANRSVFVQYHS